MKTTMSLLLMVTVLAVLCSAATASVPVRGSVSVPLSDRDTAASLGAGAWGDFFSGVGCGIGFTLMVSGYASGVGAPAAALMTAGVLASCARALGF